MEENNSAPPSQQISPVSPVGQSVPPQSPSTKQKPKFPLAAIIGIILFIFLAGATAGFYIFKPHIMKLVSTPDPTANWKTFNNTLQDTPNFTLKYPPGFRLTQQTGNGYVGGIVKPKNIMLFKFIVADFSKDEFNKSWSNLYKITYEGMTESGQHYFISENEGEINMAWIETNKLNTVLEITIETDGSLQNLQSILDTIKFTDSTSPPNPSPTINPTANRKTYKDLNNLFTVAYPPDLSVSSKINPNFGQIVTTFSKGLNLRDGKCSSISITQFTKNEAEMMDWVQTNLKKTQSGTLTAIPTVYKPYINSVDKTLVGFWVEAGSESVSKNIFVKYNNKYVLYTYGTCGDTGDSYIYHQKDADIVEEMIPTFKFTDSIATPSPTPAICNSNVDCQTGSTCVTQGPLIANQPIKKVCSEPGTANPL